MTAAAARISKEISNLSREDLDDLLRDIQAKCFFPSAGDDASVQAEWAAEIDRRAQEVMEGKVELISGEDLHRDIEAFMVELGVQHKEPVA